LLREVSFVLPDKLNVQLNEEDSLFRNKATDGRTTGLSRTSPMRSLLEIFVIL